jgi:hypothetical protein
MKSDGSFVTCPVVEFEMGGAHAGSRMITVTKSNQHQWGELVVEGCDSLAADRYILVGDDLVNCHGWVWVTHVETGYRILQMNFPPYG